MRELVVAYQMGKVGSSSIITSLDQDACIQMHSWSAMNPYPYFSSLYHGSRKGRVLDDLRWFFRYRKLIFGVKNNNEPTKLIIGVREPISRNISGYFQSLTRLRDKAIDLEKCKLDFYSHCSHFLPLTWFDIELKRKLGIDIYDYEFDQRKGYIEIMDNNFHLYVYQQEKLASLQDSIGEFLGLDSFRLERVNDSSKKWYSKLNREFLDDFVATKEYLDVMYESKYASHFYSNDLKNLKQKWGKEAI